MTLDIAMGGSTNTILHLLAAAQEANVDFSLSDIDRLSRQVPQLCKVAPNTQKYHIEDVHRAGGIPSILGELERAGLLHTDVPMVHSQTLKDTLDRWDVMRTNDATVHTFFQAGPAGIPNVEPEEFHVDESGRTIVDVHQVVRDLDGNLIVDQMVQHIYTIENHLIQRMDTGETLSTG